MPIWLNNDGLLVKSGVEEGKAALAGIFEDKIGNDHVIDATFTFADLNAYGTDTILSDTLVIPDGSRIKTAEVYVETAGVGSGASLQVGLLRTDRSTAYDPDGLVAATGVASLTAGATITGAGALVNTTLANDGLLTATVTGANFTAGKFRVRITFYTANSGTHA